MQTEGRTRFGASSPFDVARMPSGENGIEEGDDSAGDRA
jgi:hypothetical protein